MTQTSRPVAGRLTDFPNSDCGPYTGPQWREINSTLFTQDPTTQGPLLSVDDELEVEVRNAINEDLRVLPGAGFCNGALLISDANVEFSSAPNGTIVMVLNATNTAYNTNLTFPDDTTDYGVGPSVEAYTCRIALFTGPSLIQNDNIWMVPLATYSGGNTLVDDRDLCDFADAGAVGQPIYDREGDDALNNWDKWGEEEFLDVGPVRIQFGVRGVTIPASSYVTVTGGYPHAYSHAPFLMTSAFIYAGLQGAGDHVWIRQQLSFASTYLIEVWNDSASSYDVLVHWFAIGEQ